MRNGFQSRCLDLYNYLSQPRMLTMKVLFGGYHKTANLSRDPKRDGIISLYGTKGGVGNSPHFDFYCNSKIWQAPFCLFEETTILLPTYLQFWTFVIFLGCTKKLLKQQMYHLMMIQNIFHKMSFFPKLASYLQGVPFEELQK